MDKMPVYPGQIPLDINVLQPQRNTEIALGYLMQAAFGTNTLVDGLAVTPTSPASMQVKVGPGSVIFATTVDTLTTGFGSLAVDNADPLVKIGINITSTTMGALSAPSTAGYSQNWLLEAQFLEADGSPVVLPFYNASNPSVPYTGPSNTGATSNTARTNTVQLQWKSAAAAATGSQATPSPDAGWVGVAIVTVANGQSAINVTNITPYTGAPIVGTKLAVTRRQLTANTNFYVSATGNDTAGSGLSSSSPWATLQKAWNYLVTSVDMNGFSATINVANGSYSAGVVCQGVPVGYGSGNTISFVGNTSTPTSVTISASNSPCFAAMGVAINVAGFQVVQSGLMTLFGQTSVLGSCCYAYIGGDITINGNMYFGSCSGAQIYASNGGYVNLGASYNVSGGAQYHLLSTGAGAFINTSGATSLTTTIVGSLTFSVSFACSSILGCIQITNTHYSSPVTGQTYSANLNGVINTNGAGSALFPGTVGGTTATGGQYA